MSNTITDLGGGELGVRMTASRFSRRPVAATLAAGWTKIRISLLLRLNDSGTDMTGTPRFGFGFCSGDSNILGDTTTTHFVGCLSNNATWARSASPSRYSLANALVPMKRVGSTLTAGSGTFANSSNFTIHSDALSMMILDITKGTPNYTLDLFHFIGGATPPAVTQADFLTVSEMGVPAFTNHGYQFSTTLAVDETVDGTLDRGCAWWDQSLTGMDISIWRLRRVS